MRGEETAVRLYRALLRTLPPAFREDFEEEMVAWFRQHAAASPGGTRGGGLWATVLMDLVRTLWVEWWGVTWKAVERDPRGGGGGGMGGVKSDVQIAIRSLVRRPGLLMLILTTLGLGVGAATTVYSVVDAILLAPLPYDTPEQIVRVGKISEGRAGVLSVSALDLADLQERNRSFTALAASRPASMTIRGDGDPTLVRVAMVSSQFFEVLGRHPSLGRSWDPAADAQDSPPMVVLSHGLWERRWGGDRGILGRSVELNGVPYTVVGVMPRDFVPPEALSQGGTDAWLPLSALDPEARSQRNNGFLQVVGRLRPGTAIASARSELEALGASISQDFPGPGERRFGLAPLHEATLGDVGSTMFALLGGVGLLLVIGCINVANLLLMRAGERSRETAIRSALGAGRGRLIRQLMTEGLLMGLAGGVLGAAVAAGGVEAFRIWGPAQLPRLSEVRLSTGILWTAGLMSVLTGALCSLIPALRGSRAQLSVRLERGGRGHAGSRSDAALRSGLVMTEAALAIVLVVCGGLLSNSLMRLNTVDLGFDPDGVAVVSVLHTGGESPDEAVTFFQDVLERVERIPGVSATGATVSLPLGGGGQMLRVRAPGLALSAEDEEDGGYPVYYQQVAGNYFEAMRMELRSGRAFGEGDRADAPPVAIVNETLARLLSPTGTVMGSRITLSDDPAGTRPIEVVGVLADVRQQSMEGDTPPELYLPLPQLPSRRMEIVASGPGAAAALLPALREQVWAVRSDLPVRRSAEMSSIVGQSVADRRFLAAVVAGFALFALLLTIAGVYSTLAYAVSQRRREFGIRLAMGASGGSILRSVLLRSMVRVAVGCVVGVLAALPAARLLESQLFGVTPTDPTTVVVALLLVMGAAAAASLVAARRAARVDPMINLRFE